MSLKREWLPPFFFPFWSIITHDDNDDDNEDANE